MNSNGQGPAASCDKHFRVRWITSTSSAGVFGNTVHRRNRRNCEGRPRRLIAQQRARLIDVGEDARLHANMGIYILRFNATRGFAMWTSAHAVLTMQAQAHRISRTQIATCY